jgi:iron(III) transport system substrate-binding protein
MRKLWVVILAAGLVAGACGNDADDGPSQAGDGDGGGSGSLTVYSGREKDLVGPLFERFERETAIALNVRYGDTAELAAQILEEGSNSPADVFFGQDAGVLGALAKADRLAALPEDVLDTVAAGFRSSEGVWVGTSGRARTVVYNTDALSEADLPGSILDFTDAAWKGKVGWAPTNGSFQAFVTALRAIEGEDGAREWLEAMKANDAQVYEKNGAIVQAVIDGEVEVGFVNHYYLMRVLAESPEAAGANLFLPGGDPGALVNVAGVGILSDSNASLAALEFVRFLLSEESQQYFAGETFEYPLIDGVDASEGLPPLGTIEQPDIDLSDLDDLEGTLDLLREVGLV